MGQPLGREGAGNSKTRTFVTKGQGGVSPGPLSCRDREESAQGLLSRRGRRTQLGIFVPKGQEELGSGFCPEATGGLGSGFLSRRGAGGTRLGILF
jgi:hypothetical protein